MTATNLTAMTKMASTETHNKWLVMVALPPRGTTYDPAAYGEKIVRFIQEKLNINHLERIAPASVERLFIVDSTDRAASLLQTQAWIASVRPHSSQYGTYEFPVIEMLTRDEKFANKRKVQNMILEFMLEKDILKITWRKDVVYAVCTARGQKFLANLAFLGEAQRI